MFTLFVRLFKRLVRNVCSQCMLTFFLETHSSVLPHLCNAAFPGHHPFLQATPPAQIGRGGRWGVGAMRSAASQVIPIANCEGRLVSVQPLPSVSVACLCPAQPPSTLHLHPTHSPHTLSTTPYTLLRMASGSSTRQGGRSTRRWPSEVAPDPLYVPLMSWPRPDHVPPTLSHGPPTPTSGRRPHSPLTSPRSAHVRSSR